jgi:Icc-related predicted phosphoesterase
VIRVAAVGDVHVGEDSVGTVRPAFVGVADRADVLLLAGDLTRHGTLAEATVVAGELADLGLPVVAVLGNHDYHADQAVEIAALLESAGTTVLEGDAVVVEVPGGERLGVAGAKGFGGGFAGASGSDFGEPLMKAFVRHTRQVATTLLDALRRVADDADADATVALTHYSPVPDTLHGERLEIFPFLGSYLLAEAVDAGGARLAVHGHAHAGTENGATAGGVPVRNVAVPVIGRAYAVYAVPGAAAAGSRGNRTVKTVG